MQAALFCRCGLPLDGRCPRCAQHAADSRRRFGGLRDAVLARDHGRCTACGARPDRPHVHHRRPGCHVRKWLATVCPACHARVHKLGSFRTWLPPRLVQLWIEQHPGAPVQLQLFGADA